jgi:plasmid stabilization system protein ParE
MITQAKQLLIRLHVALRRNPYGPPIYRHKKHLIIYTVETNYILIVRIQHERMDIQKQL